MAVEKQVGDRLGPYALTGVLGEGGAGQVFRAAWQPSDEQRAEASEDHPDEVALKTLKADVAVNAEIFHRFVREIGVAQQIHHPNILRHYDSGLADDHLYYAMEIASYGSLRDVLRRRGSLPWRDAAETAAHVAAALGALHDAGVVHRDLKPENVFLAESGLVKLGDFGLARKEDGPALTIQGQTVGSIRYMAPEQVCGRTDLDGRCDLYALGCLLMEMLAGRPPFTATERMAVFQAHVEAPPPKLSQLAPASPSSLGTLLDRLLAKDVSDRPANAQAVEAILRAILTAEDGEVELQEDSLTGVVAYIEPQPEIEDQYEEDQVDDADDPEDDPEPDEPVGLAKRLAEGGVPAKGGGCAGALLGLITLVSVMAGLAFLG